MKLFEIECLNCGADCTHGECGYCCQAILNLTPHPINVIGANGEEIVIEPSGAPVRLATSTEPAGTHAGVPITKTVFGEPEGLPDVVAGTLILVSQLVKSALPDRADLVVPAEVVRDERGRIIGCKSLGI